MDEAGLEPTFPRWAADPQRGAIYIFHRNASGARVLNRMPRVTGEPRGLTADAEDRLGPQHTLRVHLGHEPALAVLRVALACDGITWTGASRHDPLGPELGQEPEEHVF